MSDLLSHGAAIFSDDLKYRYRLSRMWQTSDPCVTFIMLNPSTATAETDDPTIRRCMGYARKWGYGSLLIANLFAYRATDPARMLAETSPVGPENEVHVRRACNEATESGGEVICAWGVHGRHRDQDSVIMRWLDEMNIVPGCLGITKDGQPKHPLYLRGDAARMPYGGRAYAV